MKSGWGGNRIYELRAAVTLQLPHVPSGSLLPVTSVQVLGKLRVTVGDAGRMVRIPARPRQKMHHGGLCLGPCSCHPF